METKLCPSPPPVFLGIYPPKKCCALNSSDVMGLTSMELMPLHWCDDGGNDVEHAGTDHYGVNVTLVAGERLDAVGAPDVPQLGRRVAGARHKSFLGNHHVDCQPLLSNV